MMAAVIVGLVLERWPGRDSLSMLIAVVLADAADPDGGNIYPSVKRVAHLARCSERSVQYSLRDFCAIGFLTKEQDGGGRGKPTQYRIERAWLEHQPSVLNGIKKNDATPAPFCETVQGAAESPQNPCTKDAQTPQQPVHPTQQPVSNTQKVAAAARPKYELTDEGIVTVPGNVLDELGLVEIRRLDSTCPGAIAAAIATVAEQGKRPFVSAVLSHVSMRVKQCAPESGKKLITEASELNWKQAVDSDPAAMAAGDEFLAKTEARRAARARGEECDE